MALARTHRDAGFGRGRSVPARTLMAAWCVGTGAVLAASLSGVAAAAPDGRIQGRVIERSAPPHPLVNQVVRLTLIERGASSERQTRTDRLGAFVFTGLPIGGIRVFVVSTEYRSVRYESDRVTLSPSAPARSVDLAAYATSLDRSVLRAPVAFAAVDIARGGVRASVIQRFENPTDRTVIISPQDPFVFPLPPGAGSVLFLAGWRDPRIAGGRITDSFPVLPGATTVAYSYVIETRRPEVSLPWMLPHGAGDVEVLVVDVGVEVAGEGLRPLGTVTGPTGRYVRWSGGPVGPGGQVVVRLQGLPPAQARWPGLVAAAMAVTLGTALAMALRRPARTAG